MRVSDTYDSPLGRLRLLCDGARLTGLCLPAQAPRWAEPARSVENGGRAPEVLARSKRWLDRYFRGERPSPRELPLGFEGGVFSKTVWELLLDIPYAECETYGALAARVARRLGRSAVSARAVGGAVGRNPILIIAPCHRVVGADGSLTGYAGGLDIKARLLAHEGVDISRFRLPR